LNIIVDDFSLNLLRSLTREGELSENESDRDSDATPIFRNEFSSGEKNPKAPPPAKKHQLPESSPEESLRNKKFAFGVRDVEMDTHGKYSRQPEDASQILNFPHDLFPKNPKLRQMKKNNCEHGPLSLTEKFGSSTKPWQR
jgi:hypothetical protein